ncbi:MAG: pyridoxal-phosphate dependent enzyme [Planctomycetes bacterium]|nr:pyridoxal-phosphate dependent enzyme [Planctomycetota bacterium]
MGRHLWVKRDDRYGSPGGGKVRKLEFALAALLQQERRCLITFGPLGSNHVAATAVHAAGLGIETLGVLVPQPLQFYVRGNLETSCHFARVIFTRWTPGAAFIAMRHWLRRRMSTGEGPALLAPGGSSIVGILGYVEAGLEIAQDVSAGRLPEPDYAFIPAGTCGALAGLAVGLRIAGLKTRAVGVRVASRLTCTATTTAWLANRVLGLLRSRGAQLEIGRVRGHDLTMLHSFCGRGYGHATEAGREALRLAYDTEGLALDTTYTGKAMAGMLAFMAEPEHRHARALFINTWAAPALIEGPSAIPEHIERWLARRESKGGSESPR